jgi:hypothetical protein
MHAFRRVIDTGEPRIRMQTLGEKRISLSTTTPLKLARTDNASGFLASLQGSSVNRDFIFNPIHEKGLRDLRTTDHLQFHGTKTTESGNTRLVVALVRLGS